MSRVMTVRRDRRKELHIALVLDVLYTDYRSSIEPILVPWTYGKLWSTRDALESHLQPLSRQKPTYSLTRRPSTDWMQDE